jgi:ATP-dependent Zn protease
MFLITTHQGNKNIHSKNHILKKTAELIDKEISDIIEKQYIRAKEILTLNREKLDDLSKILLEKEVIFRDDLEVILGKRPNEEDEIVEPKAELLANDEEPIITEEPII